MSLKSRARSIGKQLPAFAHQRIVEDLRRYRLRPEYDHLYVAAHQASAFRERRPLPLHRGGLRGRRPLVQRRVLGRSIEQLEDAREQELADRLGVQLVVQATVELVAACAVRAQEPVTIPG